MPDKCSDPLGPCPARRTTTQQDEARFVGFATNAVGDMAVSCVDVYTIGGTISGLIGTVVLQNKNGDNLTVSTNGQFAFRQTWAGGTYAVSVYAHPFGQKCTAENNSGNINGANVSGVTVACTANTYAVGGSVNGLSGKIELQNNGGGTVIIDSTASLAFGFPTVHGANYAVTISKQPANQLCTILNAAGIADADVTNILVSCANTYTVGGTVTGLSGTVELGAVYVFTRTTASWTKQAFFKASNAGAGDAFGTSLALSADGNILAVGTPGEDSSVTGTTVGLAADRTNNTGTSAGAAYLY